MNSSGLIAAARAVAGSLEIPGGEVQAGSVGAAILTAAGSVYTGICIDTRCSLGFCAEHAAVAAMLKGGEFTVSMVVAVTEDGRILSPCGRCTELLWQLDPRNSAAAVILGEGRIASLADLLPAR